MEFNCAFEVSFEKVQRLLTEACVGGWGLVCRVTSTLTSDVVRKLLGVSARPAEL